MLEEPACTLKPSLSKLLKSPELGSVISADVVDVCTILEKCSIEEISKLLLEQGKKKKFPDITIRQ